MCETIYLTSNLRQVRVVMDQGCILQFLFPDIASYINYLHTYGKSQLSMKKYLLFTLGSIVDLFYKIATTRPGCSGSISGFQYIEWIVPTLLAISAGLFIIGKVRAAGIFGIIGLTIGAIDLLSNWLILPEFIHSRYLIQFFVFMIVYTLFFLLLSFVVIRVRLVSDNSYSVGTYLQSKTALTKVLSIMPVVIAAVGSLLWLKKY